MANSLPNWLPKIIECKDLSQWQIYEDNLYKIYLNDLFRSPPIFMNKPVKTKYYPPYKNKAFSFWHLTHEGKIESERTPDLRRCERLNWIKPIIGQEQTKMVAITYGWNRDDF